MVGVLVSSLLWRSCLSVLVRVPGCLVLSCGFTLGLLFGIGGSASWYRFAFVCSVGGGEGVGGGSRGSFPSV